MNITFDKRLNFLLIIGLAWLSSCNTTNTEFEKINLGNDTIILDNQIITLGVGSNGRTYQWSTGDTTSSINVSQQGEFWVQVKLENSEIISDTININIAYRLAKITTLYGDILLWLYPETPIHKEAFLELVNQHYFDDQTFNRVINNFVIQGGCPDEEGGFADTSLFIEAELNLNLKHIPGALGGGRDENIAWKTNICQFYIVDKSAPNLTKLDGRYSIFGQVIAGLDLVDSISNVITNNVDKPLIEQKFTIQQVNLSQDELLNLYGFDIKDGFKTINQSNKHNN